MPKRRTLDEKCVYCGKQGELTDDHIPPKNLFPEPRPSNLITVPSCSDCNVGASKDDEYFRLVLSMRHDTGDHPAVKGVQPSVIRSLGREKAIGLRKAVFDSINLRNVRTKSGICLGQENFIDVDLSRLDRVAARIARGLYFHEFNARLPLDRDVVAYSVDELTGTSEFEKFKITVKDVTRRKPRIIGNNVFAYWFQPFQEDANATFWVLLFYERVAFICFT